jgi:hypothetical protein
MVSMKGGGSSASNVVSMKGGGSAASNMVSIKGSDDFETMPVEEFQLQCAVSQKDESAGQEEKRPSQDSGQGQGEKESEEASFSYSNDGGQLFSTCS